MSTFVFDWLKIKPNQGHYNISKKYKGHFCEKIIDRNFAWVPLHLHFIARKQTFYNFLWFYCLFLCHFFWQRIIYYFRQLLIIIELFVFILTHKKCWKGIISKDVFIHLYKVFISRRKTGKKWKVIIMFIIFSCF